MSLNAGYQESNFVFNEPGIVNGHFRTFSSANMEISMVELNLQQKLSFDISDGIERVASTFLLTGVIESDDFYDHRHRRVDHSKHMLVYSLNQKNEYTLQPGKVALLNVNLKPAYFFAVSESDSNLHRLFTGGPPEDFCLTFPLSSNDQSDYRNIVNAIYTNNFSGMTRQLFTEGKGIELFALQLNELLSAKKPASELTEINKSDKDKLFAVHDFILGGFTEHLSLSELSEKFQINQFKLKKGYKLLFVHTVFGHIHDLRMQLAKKMLMSGDYGVAEVAYKVGYNSPGNFSTAFHGMFKCAPRQLLPKRSW